MTPYLPQNDPEPAKRQDWLERNQKDYEFDLDYLPPLPLLKNLPVFENFSTTYLAEVGLAAAKLTANSLAVKFQS